MNSYSPLNVAKQKGTVPRDVALRSGKPQYLEKDKEESLQAVVADPVNGHPDAVTRRLVCKVDGLSGKLQRLERASLKGSRVKRGVGGTQIRRILVPAQANEESLHVVDKETAKAAKFFEDEVSTRAEISTCPVQSELVKTMQSQYGQSSSEDQVYQTTPQERIVTSPREFQQMLSLSLNAEDENKWLRSSLQQALETSSRLQLENAKLRYSESWARRESHEAKHECDDLREQLNILPRQYRTIDTLRKDNQRRRQLERSSIALDFRTVQSSKANKFAGVNSTRDENPTRVWFRSDVLQLCMYNRQTLAWCWSLWRHVQLQSTKSHLRACQDESQSKHSKLEECKLRMQGELQQAKQELEQQKKSLHSLEKDLEQTKAQLQKEQVERRVELAEVAKSKQQVARRRATIAAEQQAFQIETKDEKTRLYADVKLQKATNEEQVRKHQTLMEQQLVQLDAQWKQLATCWKEQTENEKARQQELDHERGKLATEQVALQKEKERLRADHNLKLQKVIQEWEALENDAADWEALLEETENVRARFHAELRKLEQAVVKKDEPHKTISMVDEKEQTKEEQMTTYWIKKMEAEERKKKKLDPEKAKAEEELEALRIAKEEEERRENERQKKAERALLNGDHAKVKDQWVALKKVPDNQATRLYHELKQEKKNSNEEAKQSKALVEEHAAQLDLAKVKADAYAQVESHARRRFESKSEELRETLMNWKHEASRIEFETEVREKQWTSTLEMQANLEKQCRDLEAMKLRLVEEVGKECEDLEATKVRLKEEVRQMVEEVGKQCQDLEVTKLRLEEEVRQIERTANNLKHSEATS